MPFFFHRPFNADSWLICCESNLSSFPAPHFLWGAQRLCTACIWSDRCVSLVHLSQDFVIYLRRQGTHHVFFHFFRLGLVFDYCDKTIDSFPFEIAVVVFDFFFQHWKSSLRRMIELRGCPIGMQKQVDENFFYFYVTGIGKFLDKTLNPNFCVVFLS